MTASSRTTKKKYLLGTLILAVTLATGVTSWKKFRAGSSNTQRLGIVTRGDLIQRITVAGVVVPRKRTLILPPYSGYIRKMYVQIGQQVKAGDPLVSIVPTLISQDEVFPIRAPFPGTVVQVSRSDGEFVQDKGDENFLIRIDDLSQLFVSADVPEIDMVKIRVGQDVIIRASAIVGRSFKGVIREIAMAAREKKEWSRTGDKVDYPVRIEITDKDREIRSGMSTLVDIIPAKREKVLTLKHEFLQKKDDRYFVILADGTKKDIQVGLQNEEMFEITGGLNEGDKVRQTDFLALSRDQ